jgi:hypothetical protein
VGIRVWKNTGVAATLNYAGITDANTPLFINEVRLHLASPVAATLILTVENTVASYNTKVYTQAMTSLKNHYKSFNPPITVLNGETLRCSLNTGATFGLIVIGS